MILAVKWSIFASYNIIIIVNDLKIWNTNPVIYISQDLCSYIGSQFPYIPVLQTAVVLISVHRDMFSSWWTIQHTYVTIAPSSVLVYGRMWLFMGGEGGGPQFAMVAV